MPKFKFTFPFLLVFLFGSAPLLMAQEFNNKLPIPYLIDSDTVLLRIDQVEHNFNPNGDSLNMPINAFAFNHLDSTHLPNTILGPTIKWKYGTQLHTEVFNNLGTATTTHWHGAHVPQFADGGPHQVIPADSTWKIDFEILDKSATMWYHPHRMDLTYKHVQLGLSGMIYVEDDENDPILSEIHRILPHDYNVNDFPIIVQSKKFVKSTCETDNEYSIFSELGFNSDFVYMVNGMMNPVLEVPAGMIRLRMLNGDSKYAFNFTFGDKTTTPQENFHMIATDAGYMDRSYEKDQIMISPGERTELLLDLRGRAGDVFYLNNFAEGMGPAIVGSALSSKGKPLKNSNLLKIVVTDDFAPQSPIISFPIPLHPLEIPEYDANTKERTKTFYRSENLSITDTTYKYVLNDSNECVRVIDKIKNHADLYNIDKTLMNMMVVNDTVMKDSTEIWTLVNKTDIAHPFHIHDIHFYVTEISYSDTLVRDTTEINITADTSNQGVIKFDTSYSIVYTTEYVPIARDSIPRIFSGPKDNVLVESGWKLSFVTTFSDFGTPIHPRNSYMYHCHILPHEDRGMMGQFVVWDGSVITNTEDVPIQLNQSIKLYPNPTSGQLYLDGISEKESQLRVFDIQGKLLRSQSLQPFNGVHSFSIEGLPKGLVFVEWMTEKGRFMSKVVLE